MSKPLTIIVGGYIVGFPLGGMTWHHLNYVLGLHEMGHDVWFYEYGNWPPYNPRTQICSWEHVAYGTEYLGEQFEQYGLPPKWCYSVGGKSWVNLSGQELTQLFTRADLMLCVSGVTPLDEVRPRPRRLAVIDTDPVFTQLRMRDNEAFLNYYKQFDAVATFGRLIGTSDCPLPTHGFAWIPTNQPVSLRHWPVVPTTSHAFTTIGKWEHTADRHLEFEGKRYLSSKGVEWMKMLNLPVHSKVPLTLGMQQMPGDVAERFRGHGWTITDPEQASMSCAAFQKFIQGSAGEFTVAKEIYAGLPSGWFSDRSAAYLASGRPVVTQASGFDPWLPTGEGLFSFNDVDEAARALNAIAADYERHARAARRIAEQYFDARKVLSDLLDRVL
jgi:hypothetical protein